MTAPPPKKASSWWFRKGRFIVSHLLLAVFALTTLLPFLWMVTASMKPLDAVEELNPLPSKIRREQFAASPGAGGGEYSLASYYKYHARKNYHDVWSSKDISFRRYYFNSLLVAGWVTFLTCVTSALAAYAFSRMHWPGRDAVFRLYLATMMIPGIVTMIPNFALMVGLHLMDSYLGLIVPACFSAFGTFMLRQFMLTIPPSLDEAASMDGASHWRIFWDVIIPLSRPGLIVLALFTFMGNYGSFFWPLVMIKSEHLRTLPIGMVYFDTAYGSQTNLIMAASVLNILPLIILFTVLQKHLVQGIQLGAVKG